MKSIFLLFALLLLIATPAIAAEVPDGFAVTQVATGMTSVTRMELLPDGRILVLEQGGNIRVIENGVLRSTPFLSLDVDSFSEHGLLGIALDPVFETNHYFYVYYTAKTPVLHNRVSRFTVNGDSADPASEVVIFELDELTGPLGWHQGGNLRFGRDGMLYIAVGDDRNGANSQVTTNLFGKILRINSDGSIPTDNPFYATSTGNNRAIWALGLRNPYTFGVQPGTGRIFIDDVGQNTWEEIDDGIAGSNYGWPYSEGFRKPTDTQTTIGTYRDPLYAYDHSNGSIAIVGGTFYNPASPQFPS